MTLREKYIEAIKGWGEYNYHEYLLLVDISVDELDEEYNVITGETYSSEREFDDFYKINFFYDNEEDCQFQISYKYFFKDDFTDKIKEEILEMAIKTIKDDKNKKIKELNERYDNFLKDDIFKNVIRAKKLDNINK